MTLSKNTPQYQNGVAVVPIGLVCPKRTLKSKNSNFSKTSLETCMLTAVTLALLWHQEFEMGWPSRGWLGHFIYRLKKTSSVLL